jgi:hypothetical protein
MSRLMKWEGDKPKYVEHPFNEKRSPAEVRSIGCARRLLKNLEMLLGIN